MINVYLTTDWIAVENSPSVSSKTCNDHGASDTCAIFDNKPHRRTLRPLNSLVASDAPVICSRMLVRPARRLSNLNPPATNVHQTQKGVIGAKSYEYFGCFLS